MFVQQGSYLLCMFFIFVICKFAQRSHAQTGGDDSYCLTGLASSLQSSVLSTSWTPGNLKTPCISGSASSLFGIGCNNNRVYSITLNSSGLVGTISPSLANCSLLETIDMSSNKLSGNIPSNIGNLTYLVSFNLSHNLLDGPIPNELGACAYLNVIDMNHNKLSGQIPPQLGLLQRLKYFDVSENDLSGAIPTTLSNTSTGLPRFNVSSFDGNSDLYGYPLPPANNHGLSVLAIVCIGLASGLISLFVSFTAVCLWLRITEQGYAAQEGKISQLMSES